MLAQILQHQLSCLWKIKHIDTQLMTYFSLVNATSNVKETRTKVQNSRQIVDYDVKIINIEVTFNKEVQHRSQIMSSRTI